MNWKIIFGLAFAFIAVNLLFVYWFVPLDTVEFSFKQTPRNYNFSLNNAESMQFYENMRFQKKEIPYKINPECTLRKKSEMERAMEILSNQTPLSFRPVSVEEEITITCQDENKIEGNLFIAGEGGPVNITRTDNFNVILYGKILLIRDSNCERPNIAIHELLHVLGFDHSPNPRNIMYNTSKCSQILSDDMVEAINDLYSVSSYADLSFENVSAKMNGRNLDLNLSIRNNGLANAGNSKLMIYADDKLIKETDVQPIKIGFGLTMTFGNLFVNQVDVNELKLSLQGDFSELDKDNNIIKLEIKE